MATIAYHSDIFEPSQLSLYIPGGVNDHLYVFVDARMKACQSVQ